MEMGMVQGCFPFRSLCKKKESMARNVRQFGHVSLMSCGRVGKLLSMANTDKVNILSRAYCMSGTMPGILYTISLDYHKAL